MILKTAVATFADRDAASVYHNAVDENLLRFYQEELGQVTRELIQMRNELEWLRDSVGWKIFEALHRRLKWVLPASLRRTRWYKRCRQGALSFFEDGAGTFFAKLKHKSKLWNALHANRGTARGWDAGYDEWARKREIAEIEQARSALAGLTDRPVISIVMPVYNMNAEHLRLAIDSVRAQIYPTWELCICDDGSTDGRTPAFVAGLPELDARIKVVCAEKNQGIALASNQALALATGEFIALMDGDDEIPPHALFEIVRHLNDSPRTDFIYSDRDKIDVAGKRFEPFFKPDWSPDLFLSCNYACHLVAMRASLVREARGFRAVCEGSQDYDLFLRVLEKTNAIHHLPKVLYHWRVSPTSTAGDGRVKMHAHVAARLSLEESFKRQGIDARVERGYGVGLWRIRYPFPETARVSVIIPAGGNLPCLEQCLRGLREQTSYRNFEIILIDNSRGNGVADAFGRFQRLWKDCRYLDCREEPFNFSRLNNRAAAEAQTPFLLFLNDDVAPLAPDWLAAMLEHAHRQEVGAVGPMLLYEDKTVQHAGIIMGLNGCCDHGMKYLNQHDLGYHNFHNMTRNCSAVTAACLLTRREVFDDVGGFDEALPVAFQDVDFCLKIRERGLSVVYTPFAKLCHYEGKTKQAFGLEKVAGFEEALIAQRWGRIIARDPFYSQHLSRTFPGYRLDLSA